MLSESLVVSGHYNPCRPCSGICYVDTCVYRLIVPLLLSRFDSTFERFAPILSIQTPAFHKWELNINDDHTSKPQPHLLTFVINVFIPVVMFLGRYGKQFASNIPICRPVNLTNASWIPGVANYIIIVDRKCMYCGQKRAIFHGWTNQNHRMHFPISKVLSSSMGLVSRLNIFGILLLWCGSHKW